MWLGYNRNMPQDQALARISTGFPAGILSVSELNRSVRDLLEHRYPLLWVRGEISNFIAAKSGHLYFVLKDAQAQIRCAMFRNRNQQLNWVPRDGMQVEVQGLVTLYENRGDFQLIAESMRQAGRGTLFEAFLQLKTKLEKEGLFDSAHKKALPYLARSVGIVTSSQGAALRDVLTTLARRNPSINVVIYPTQVQGEGAGLKIAQAISTASARGECEVLIVCRGGGSIEDLWAFNNESVARAIHACPVPVISGVGHETDFTIADFAADVRAPTPTAAAELVSPERSALLDSVSALLSALGRRVRRDIDNRIQAVDHLSRSLKHPAQRLRERESHVTQLELRLERAAGHLVEQRGWILTSLLQRLRGNTPRAPELAARVSNHLGRMDAALRSLFARDQAQLEQLLCSLKHLAPQGVLDRGYSLARDSAGELVRDASKLRAGSALDITFARGGALARVEFVKDGPE